MSRELLLRVVHLVSSVLPLPTHVCLQAVAAALAKSQAAAEEASKGGDSPG